MKPNQQSYSDHPTTHDELGFAPSTKAILNIINGLSLDDTPLSIGIFGPWGSGKTSQMQMILAGLGSAPCIPIWFDAWRYAHSDALWRALLISVVEGIRDYVLDDDERLKTIIERRHQIDPEKHRSDTSPEARKAEREKINNHLDDLIGSLYRSVEREESGGIEVNWGEAGKVAIRSTIQLGLSSLPVLGLLTTTFEKAVEAAQEKIGEGEDAATLFDIFQRERSKIYCEHVRSLEQFYQQFKQLVKEWVIDTNLRLIVFIDDLDRCLPEQAIGVLEAVKVFLDIQGCIFLLGVDREVIERGICVRYKDFALANDLSMQQGTAGFPIAGRDYLDKIIQVPFELPPLEDDVIRDFVLQRLQQQEGLDETQYDTIADIMAQGLSPNPRKVKRTLNTFRLLLALGGATVRPIQPGLLAKLVVIQSSFPRVYERVVREPAVLKLLEQVVTGQMQTTGSQEHRDIFVAIFPESFEHFRTMFDAERGTMVAHSGLSPRWVDILSHAAPRLKVMLELKPEFTELTDDELRGLVFLTRRTQ